MFLELGDPVAHPFPRLTRQPWIIRQFLALSLDSLQRENFDDRFPQQGAALVDGTKRFSDTEPL